jgi:hypothetical protein
MDPAHMALLIPIIAMFIPITAIWTSHQRKMAEIKAQQGMNVAPDVRRDLAEIKQQISELRDTTTRFDMSFDAAITHLEQRVDSMEADQIEMKGHRVTATNSLDSEPVVLQTRGRG